MQLGVARLGGLHDYPALDDFSLELEDRQLCEKIRISKS